VATAAEDRLSIRAQSTGPFRGHLAIYADTPAAERVAVLLSLLGAERRMVLPAGDIEAAG
jgi:hypothetical protein